jgi:hypothetical protein
LNKSANRTYLAPPACAALPMRREGTHLAGEHRVCAADISFCAWQLTVLNEP